MDAEVLLTAYVFQLIVLRNCCGNSVFYGTICESFPHFVAFLPRVLGWEFWNSYEKQGSVFG
jgi:hypothetical protein